MANAGNQVVQETRFPTSYRGIKPVPNPALVFQGPPPGFVYMRVWSYFVLQKRTGAQPIITIPLAGTSYRIYQLFSRNQCRSHGEVFTVPHQPRDMDDLELSTNYEYAGIAHSWTAEDEWLPCPGEYWEVYP